MTRALTAAILTLALTALTSPPWAAQAILPATGAPPIVERHIVVVSDSHGNCSFGEELNTLLRTLPQTFVHSLAVGGSSPRTWLDPKQRIVSPYGVEDRGNTGEPLRSPRPIGSTRTPHFPKFLDESFAKNPVARRIVIVNLGSNSFSATVLKSGAEAMVREIHARNAECLWIAPPHMRKWSRERLESYAAAIRQGVDAAGSGGPSNQKCQVTDSLSVTEFPAHAQLPPGGMDDGVHYCWNPKLLELGREFARWVFTQIR
ncbi:MAG: SGNH/GDSL hydrolase family protein [Bdellovibrionales bacterium]|nr:SGNH/GDSL hydrolase family protein [Bdellovibrionales bacterium]